MKKNIYADPTSRSNPNFFLTKHIEFEWNVDFERKIIYGTIVLHCIRNSSGINTETLTLDTKGLTIHEVHETTSNVRLAFDVGGEDKNLGEVLYVNLKQLHPSKLDKISLQIKYETSPNSTALQWLEPNQTIGKKYPYLFSQCQAIHARSLFPCQDTPSVKFTYSAKVNVKEPFVALMSAIRANSEPIKLNNNLFQYEFSQNIPIPSYLVAIAVGDLVSKKLGPRSHVWTERELIEDSAKEFSETEDMLQAAESIAGKYVWGIYDILVLPPTFPYGGMENPCLTFATPTLIAGDRSLATVIIHEISHSWTGNLVTNRTWEHFWLNEGFTMFLERKIIARMKNCEKHRQFDCIEGYRHLKQAVYDFGETHEFTKLVPNLKNSHPDDAFSTVPYEKGHTLLFYLEEILGGKEIFDKYLRAHIDHFKDGRSIDSEDWKEYLYEYFNDKKSILDTIDWNAWFYGTGMPPFEPKFDRTLADECINLCKKLISEDILCVDPVFKEFSSPQVLEVVSLLLDGEPLNHKKMESLHKHYPFLTTRNCEILFKFLRLGIKAEWNPIIQPALNFVTQQGRMKYTRPIYKDLFKWDAARELAIETFLKNRPYMHQTTATLVAKDLKLQ